MAYQKFIEYYLNSISLEPYVSGMAQPKLNQKFLNSITVPWPLKTAGAAEVVEKLEGLSFETKRLETIYQQKLDRLAELKQAILHKAFAGELSVLPEKTREEAVA
jgi:type I restriction enzyme S subunit